MKRFKIQELYDLVDSYKANPGSTCPVAVGQLLFALNTCTTCTFLGQCVNGTSLIPWGVRCSASSGSGCLYYGCGFCPGTGTYVALGAVCACGATLWRRIS